MLASPSPLEVTEIAFDESARRRSSMMQDYDAARISLICTIERYFLCFDMLPAGKYFHKFQVLITQIDGLNEVSSQAPPQASSPYTGLPNSLPA